MQQIFPWLIALALSPLPVPAQPRITITLYDRAHITEEVREDMKNETSKILLAAGVQLEWVDCEVADQYSQLAECVERLSATRLMLQLIPGKHPRFPRAAGMAVVQDESSFFACLYPERVNQLAREAGWEFGDLLGHAAAHELGHLLLRSSTHTPAGVMRAQGEFGDLQKLPHAGLFFLPGQLSAIPAATRQQQADAGGRPR